MHKVSRQRQAKWIKARTDYRRDGQFVDPEWVPFSLKLGSELILHEQDRMERGYIS